MNVVVLPEPVVPTSIYDLVIVVYESRPNPCHHDFGRELNQLAQIRSLRHRLACADHTKNSRKQLFSPFPGPEKMLDIAMLRKTGVLCRCETYGYFFALRFLCRLDFISLPLRIGYKNPFQGNREL